MARSLMGTGTSDKAENRRERVAIFGGSQNKAIGRRSQKGKKFNRRKPTGPQGPSKAPDTGYTGANGADLGLNEGVTPEGNLWQTWTPATNPYTGQLSGPFETGSGSYQIGTLSTGAQGYYDPKTGKFQSYDPFYADTDDDG
jgi:hypothetical protein